MAKRNRKTDVPIDLDRTDPDLIREENLAESGGRRLRREIRKHTSTGPKLTGGDVDADWQDALDVGDEAVGGHAPTPDQDEVDEIGRALGVEADIDEEVHTHEEILSRRDGHRWELDRRSADEETDSAGSE
jgi:uncharacterized protein DUF6335